MASDDFWDDVFSDTCTDVFSTLIVTGIKAGARAGLGLLKDAGQRTTTTAARAPLHREDPHSAALHAFDRQLGLDSDALGQALEEVEDPFAAPTTCAHRFLDCLSRGDHHGACRRCEPELFQDDARRPVLLETLAAGRPRRWRCRYYHHPEGWHAGEALPWVGIDYDVVFRVGSGARTLTLVVWVVPFGQGWAVWNLEWGPIRAE